MLHVSRLLRQLTTDVTLLNYIVQNVQGGDQDLQVESGFNAFQLMKRPSNKNNVQQKCNLTTPDPPRPICHLAKNQLRPLGCQQSSTNVQPIAKDLKKYELWTKKKFATSRKQ